MSSNNPFFKRRENLARNLPSRPTTKPADADSPADEGSLPTPTHRAEVQEEQPSRSLQRKDMFNALIDNYDDEEEALLNAKQQNSLTKIVTQSEIDSPILGKIEQNIKNLQKKYPTGGIKASRYLTADILIEAPRGFFDMYEPTVEAGVNYVRAELIDSDQSARIAEAEQNPTDDYYQDNAFYIVQSIVSDFMSRENWRDTHRRIVSALILNEILGFGRLEPLWRDRKIDEIVCNGPKDIQVEISGELTKVPGCEFRNPEHLMRLIEKLYGSIGKTLTPLTPLVKGRLHDKSRMFAVHQTVAPDGPNLSIRRHPEGFWTPKQLVEFGSAPPELMADLGNMIYKGASPVVVGGTSSGKACVYNTRIHTPSGTTTMGEISVGDKIFDHHGNIATVLEKFPQPARQVYAVKFSNGQTSYVDAEHNWYVSTHQSRKTGNSDLYSIWTTEKMMNSEIVVNSDSDNHHNFHIPVLEKSVEYDNAMSPEELPIHPYLLGLWLSDSESKTVNLPNTKEWGVTTEDFTAKLSELGMIQKTPTEGSQKRVPDVYKYASIEARRMLIAGLIDRDEWIDDKVTEWITNANKNLVSDYVQIVSSLGYVVHRSNHELHSHLIARREKEIEIIDIYPVEGRIEEMACITVDSPDSTYMIEDSFITTHNTSLLNSLTGFLKPRVRILTLEDNLEMKPNPKKLLAAAMECKLPTSNSDSGVSMRDLVKASLQLRPDVIIVGEVTDDAAFDLAQALNTGHQGASTIHANTAEAAIPRISSLIAQSGLATIEGSLDMIAAAFDIIVVTKHFPVDGSRRIVSIEELGTSPIEIDGRLTLETIPLWKFYEKGLDQNGKVVGEWHKLNDLSKKRRDQKNLNIEKDLQWEELQELSSIPEGYAIHGQDDTESDG